MLSKISNFSHALHFLGIKSHSNSSPTSLSKLEDKFTALCPRCGLRQPPEASPMTNPCPVCRVKNGAIYFLSPNQSHRRHTNFITPPSKKFPILQFLTIENPSDVDKVYTAIEDYYSLTGQSFIDDSFPHSDRSIGLLQDLDVSKRRVVWLRPTEIYSKECRSPWTVFNNPRPKDIVQGKALNCWLISALAVIAERPEILRKIILTPGYNPAGVYKIRLCIDGIWQTIFVDDFFPCYTNTRSMVFAVGRHNQLWVSLIEKALSKYRGSYSALENGYIMDAFSTLTGAPSELIEVEINSTPAEGQHDKLELIWACLISANDAKFLMGVSSGTTRTKVNLEEYNQLGLVPNHGYSILDVRQYGSHRLLKLQNPMGNFVWLGKWSSTWPGWTPEAKDALDFEKLKDEEGTFWIPFEEIVKLFSDAHIANVNRQWFSQRFKFDLDWERASIMKVTVHESTEMCFSLFQRHPRTSINKADLLLLVHKEDRTAECQIGELVIRSTRRVLPHVRTEDMLFEPGTYIVCAMSFLYFCENKKIAATMVVHAAKPMEATMESVAPDVLRQSLVQMTLQEAKIEEVLPNIKFYHMHTRFSGYLSMVDNLNESQCVKLKMDCRRSKNIISSRGTIVVTDCIPPLHRQIVIVLTPDKAEQSADAYYDFRLRMTEQNMLGVYAVEDPTSQHEPGVDDPLAQAVLHAPRSLNILPEGSKKSNKC